MRDRFQHQNAQQRQLRKRTQNQTDNVKWSIYDNKPAQFCLHVIKNTERGWESLRKYLSLSEGYGIKLVAAEAFIGCELHQA